MFTDRAWKSIKAEKQHGVMETQGTWRMEGVGGGGDLDGEHFISDDTCISMAFAELQSATMTNKEKHSSCQPALKDPWSTFQPGMPVEQDYAGKQKADVVRALCSAAVF